MLPFCSKNPLPGRVCVRAPRATGCRAQAADSPPEFDRVLVRPYCFGPNMAPKMELFRCCLKRFSRRPKDASKKRPRRPKSTPRRPKRRPRRPKMPPRSAQDAPRAPQDAPRGAQDLSKSRPRAPKRLLLAALRSPPYRGGLGEAPLNPPRAQPREACQAGLDSRSEGFFETNL